MNVNLKPLLLTAAFAAAGLSFGAAQAQVVPSPVTVNMPVKIEIQNACEISTAPTVLDFGVHGVLSANIDQFSNLYVTCTTGAIYNIGLGGGGSGDINARVMTLLTEDVGYQLYQDPGRATLWGDVIGTNTQASLGTGIEQNFPVYGRVPPQTTPAAGVYTDTVVVTVSY